MAELTDEEILILLDHGDQSLVTAVERILTAREAAAEHEHERLRTMLNRANAHGAEARAAHERLYGQVHDLLDGKTIAEWHEERCGLSEAIRQAARRGAVNALRTAADDMEQFEPFSGEEPDWLRERADRIEAGDA